MLRGPFSSLMGLMGSRDRLRPGQQAGRGHPSIPHDIFVSLYGSRMLTRGRLAGCIFRR